MITFGTMGAKVVIGITGGSGSGKSSLVGALCDALPSDAVAVLSQDDYYLPVDQQQRDANGEVNFDLPTALDLDKFVTDIRGLKKGRRLELLEYGFNAPNKTPITKVVEPRAVTIVEGLFLMQDEAIRGELDHAVFVETDVRKQLERRVERDRRERGYEKEKVSYQWENHVLPAYASYLLPYRDTCDLVLQNGGHLDQCVEQLLDYVAIRVGLPLAAAQLM